MFDAVVFDLDGTLLDTESIAMAAGMQVFADFGHPIELAFLHGLIGKDEVTGSALMAARLGPDFPLTDLRRVWRSTVQTRFGDGIPLRPGVLDLLSALDDLGMPRAIATSSRRDSALWKLERAGLGTRFETVVGLGCIQNPKPAPDPFLLAAKLLDVAPARCLAFEDSDTGAASALAAGMVVVQVPDVLQTEGHNATHVAVDLMSGARAAGLLR
ncbi:MAG: HAD family phosphatase [Gemmobacter sp.]|nr:HAD family phosphatase [Gemmobacter sp.]